MFSEIRRKRQRSNANLAMRLDQGFHTFACLFHVSSGIEFIILRLKLGAGRTKHLRKINIVIRII